MIKMELLGYGPNFNIALNMPLEQLKFYCISNELFRKICSDQEFWIERLRREYLTLIQYKPVDMTYGQYYTGLETKNIKIVYVAYNARLIGVIPMFSTDMMGDVFQRAVDLLKVIDPTFDPSETFLDSMQFGTTPSAKYGEVTIRHGVVEDELKSRAAKRSVQKPWLDWNYIQGPTFWNDLEIISMFSTELYPEGQEPVFWK
jgi:hypothetical protein